MYVVVKDDKKMNCDRDQLKFLIERGWREETAADRMIVAEEPAPKAKKPAKNAAAEDLLK